MRAQHPIWTARRGPTAENDLKRPDAADVEDDDASDRFPTPRTEASDAWPRKTRVTVTRKRRCAASPPHQRRRLRRQHPFGACVRPACNPASGLCIGVNQPVGTCDDSSLCKGRSAKADNVWGTNIDCADEDDCGGRLRPSDWLRLSAVGLLHPRLSGENAALTDAAKPCGHVYLVVLQRRASVHQLYPKLHRLDLWR